MGESDWQALTPDQKQTELIRQQEETLQRLLARNAITKSQYDASMAMLKNSTKK